MPFTVYCYCLNVNSGWFLITLHVVLFSSDIYRYSLKSPEEVLWDRSTLIHYVRYLLILETTLSWLCQVFLACFMSDFSFYFSCFSFSRTPLICVFNFLNFFFKFLAHFYWSFVFFSTARENNTLLSEKVISKYYVKVSLSALISSLVLTPVAPQILVGRLF